MKLMRATLLFLALLCASPAYAGLVQSANAAVTGGAGTVTLTGVNPSDTLILFSFSVSGSSSVPSSTPAGYSIGNVPTVYAAFDSISTAIYYNQSPASGTNTVNISYTAGGSGHILLVEWSGMPASALDVAPAASNATTATTSGTSSISSGTLGQANEVVFVFMAETTSGAGDAVTGLNIPATGGFTNIFSNSDSNTDFLYAVNYKIVSATASVTAGWTWTDTASIASQAIAATFKINPPVTATTTGSSLGLMFP